MLCCLVFLASYGCKPAEPTPNSKNLNAVPKDFVLGEIVTLNSKILNEDRILNIYLPAGYGTDPLKKYPVIYLLDGSSDEDFIHIVGLAQFANFPWTKMLEPTIIVGIGNVDRKRDFTYPSNNEQDNTELPTSGGSDKFIAFLESELQPYIASHYSTNNNKTIIGQSLGGLLATEILYTKSELFTNYIIVSPSLWWDDESLLSDKTIADFAQKKTVYLAVGKEGEVMESVAKKLNQKLSAVDEEDLSIYFDYIENVKHGNILHLAVYRAFEKFFMC